MVMFVTRTVLLIHLFSEVVKNRLKESGHQTRLTKGPTQTFKGQLWHHGSIFKYHLAST